MPAPPAPPAPAPIAVSRPAVAQPAARKTSRSGAATEAFVVRVMVRVLRCGGRTFRPRGRASVPHDPAKGNGADGAPGARTPGRRAVDQAGARTALRQASTRTAAAPRAPIGRPPAAPAPPRRSGRG